MFTIFATSYTSNGVETRLNATGFFYACTLQTICGFVTPCRALMRRLPFDRCKTAGSAEPFLISAKRNNYKAMSKAIENCLNVNNSTVPATSADETCTRFIAFVNERYPQLNRIKYKISKNGKYLCLRAQYRRRSIHAEGRDFEKTISCFYFYLLLKLSIDKYYSTLAEMREKRPLEPFFVRFQCEISQTFNN